MRRLDAPIARAVADGSAAASSRSQVGAALLAGVVLAALLVVAQRKGALRALRVGALCAVPAGLVLTLASAWRAPLPDPSGYVDSRPLVGTLPPAAGSPVRVDPGVSPWWSWPGRVYEDRLGDMVVTRSCGGSICALVLGKVEPDMPIWPRARVTVDGTGPVSIRRDARLGVLFVEDASGVRALSGGAAIDVDLADIASGARPPIGWVLSAALGLGAAIGTLWRARRHERRVAELDRGRAGAVGTDGWIAFDEPYAPARAAEGLIGPVLVLGAAGGGGYRGAGAGTAWRALPGTRAELVDRELGRSASLSALALAVALLALAPLVAASALGLVF
jgi:hypothetical protein